MGTRMFAVSSGIMWARGSSSFSTVSTSMVLNLPDGVSRIYPMGTRASFPVSSVRMFFRMVKALRWLSMVEAVPNQVLPK